MKVCLLDSRQSTKARLIAFYLPQFHPIPENDQWWGKGFTEWTNVAKAKPLFRGHHQPHFPADLGYYDLRVPEVRDAQAEMARSHGIEGFCYWHYWFAGKRMLERPFHEVLASGEPAFPFCLAWANQSWTGIWHGAPNRILIEQTYPGMDDHCAHFYHLLNALADERYIRIDNKPIFLVYSPQTLPDSNRFTDYWRELALKEGLNGIYFIGIAGEGWNPISHGFDASILNVPGSIFPRLPRRKMDLIVKKIMGMSWTEINKTLRSLPAIYSYERMINHILPQVTTQFERYPCVIPKWDNTPRSGLNGIVFHNSTPALFGIHLKEAIKQVAPRKPDKRLVFIKSWNEWAEGNYLEPDQRFGKAYLEIIQRINP